MELSGMYIYTKECRGSGRGTAVVSGKHMGKECVNSLCSVLL